MRDRITSAARGNTDLVGLLVLLLVVLVAYQHYDSSLLSPASVTILSAQFLPLILAAAGQTTVMLLGGSTSPWAPYSGSPWPSSPPTTHTARAAS